MSWKKFGKALLFPPIAVLACLSPLSLAALIFAALYFPSDSVFSICAYAASAYVLTAWCFRIPRIIAFFKAFKEKSAAWRRWREDTRFRVRTMLFFGVALNTAFAIFQLGLGFTHGSFWFFSLAGYYITLAVLRLFLAYHTVKNKAGERMRAELQKYRATGWVLLCMNLFLSVIVFFMVYFNRTFYHHEITTIAMAAYTFTAFTLAIIDMVRFRQYKSPVYSASRAINLAAACVSMLTLESTMLTTFGEAEGELFRRLMLALTGGAISICFIALSVYMIVQATGQLRKSKETDIEGKVHHDGAK